MEISIALLTTHAWAASQRLSRDLSDLQIKTLGRTTEPCVLQLSSVTYTRALWLYSRVLWLAAEYRDLQQSLWLKTNPSDLPQSSVALQRGSVNDIRATWSTTNHLTFTAEHNVLQNNLALLQQSTVTYNRAVLAMVVGLSYRLCVT